MKKTVTVEPNTKRVILKGVYYYAVKLILIIKMLVSKHKKDGKTAVRFCTSWATKEENVAALLADIERVLAR